MRYVDVRIRVPENKAGTLMYLLPSWAVLVGMDTLESPIATLERAHTAYSGDNSYRPKEGSAGEAVLSVLEKGPVRPIDIIAALEKQFKQKAVHTGIYQLRNKGLIKKLKDGTYGLR